MSLIAKLWGAKQSIRQIAEAEGTGVKLQTLGPTDRNSVHFGTDRVRILLFRECEWRGRKLLFDSIAAGQSKRCNSDNVHKNHVPLSCRNLVKNEQTRSTRDNSSPEFLDTIACEHGKLLSEDISLLSEMIFGTVAMTYRGPSFKIHAMNSPGCIMCTKVFPFAEHSVCRQSDRHSSDSLGTSTNLDSNSSSSTSLRAQNSRSGSGNLSGNIMNPGMRKNSTCSSTGSGWDIDVPRLGSSHSLDGNVSGMSGGSLSSLRRRWLRAASTSLNRSGSDDTFGQNYEGSSINSSEMVTQKHKTRLGLAMLLQLPTGEEREISSRLVEHSAILEGMLDRLRHSCMEARGPERSLVARLYCASDSSTLRLLKLLLTPDSDAPAPLMWHDLLLNCNQPVHIQVDTVYFGLDQMYQILYEFDTKSTNFFISTIVTAVLTHHLGWVHTAPSYKNRQMMETFGQQYPCNPLWAQLSDLQGALGNPLRVSQTVIAGEPDKASLIESVLNFLSYFLRSGIVEKRQEIRCPSQEDVHEAISILKRALRKNPALERPSSFSSGKRVVKSSVRRPKQLELPIDESDTAYSLIKSKSYEEPQKIPKFQVGDDCPASKSSPEEAAPKKMKRSSTLQKNMNEYAPVNDKEVEDKPHVAGKVKLIMNDEDKQKVHNENGLVRNIEKSNIDEEANENTTDQKLPTLRRQKFNGLDSISVNHKVFDDQSLASPYTLEDDAARQVKSQVYFTLGDEDKPNLSIREKLKSACKCQCSYTFTRVPSTSSELPEGVLRKIIQRNFPESSKNMQPAAGCEGEFGLCLKCRRGYASSSQSFEIGKLLLETPTNATEMLRGCGNTASSTVLRSNSLEALIEANCVIELPMPRSKKVPPQEKKKLVERIGFSKSLLGTKVNIPEENITYPESGYTWGMVMQGFTKKKKKGRRRTKEAFIKESTSNFVKQGKRDNEEWWWPIREGLGMETKYPLIDHPVSEALCILGDLDNWQVGLLSTNSVSSNPIPVGMSRLVSNMLEAFAHMWKESRSPKQCIKLLESRLREMWQRSETLAEFLLAANLEDATVNNLTNFLDVDAADLPLLLAIATTHSPQIAQRFGLTLA